MKIEVDEGELERIIKGLEQYHAYTIATNTDDSIDVHRRLGGATVGIAARFACDHSR